MNYYFSRSLQGFPSEEMLGPLRLLVPDPEWAGEGEAPFISVPNPSTLMPADSEPISPELRAELLAAPYGIDWDAMPLPKPRLEPAQTQEQRAAEACRLLEKSDRVAIRCFKGGVAYPQAWRDRDTLLRGIVNGSSDPLPSDLDYPAGS